MTAFTPKSAKPDNVTDRGKVERIKLSGAGDSTEETEWIDVATQAELDAHLNDVAAAHAASAISFTPGGTIAGDTVQTAVAEVATDAATALTTHGNLTTSVHGIADTSALVTLTGSETLTNKTLTTPVLTLEQGASVAPTAEGRIAWDTDDNQLRVGDGTGTAAIPKITVGTSQPSSPAVGDLWGDTN